MTVQGSNNFADAPTIGYGHTSAPTPSAGLSTEPGEPFGTTGLNRSAWWKVTVPRTETVGIELLQSVVYGDVWDADPYVTVWTGDTLTGLTRVARGDDNTYPDAAGYGWLTDMDFDGVAGQTYYIQVACYTWSDDLDYVLQVGKRVITYGAPVQGGDYTAGNYTTKAMNFGGESESADYVTWPNNAELNAQQTAARNLMARTYGATSPNMMLRPMTGDYAEGEPVMGVPTTDWTRLKYKADHWSWTQVIQGSRSLPWLGDKSTWPVNATAAEYTTHDEDPVPLGATITLNFHSRSVDDSVDPGVSPNTGVRLICRVIEPPGTLDLDDPTTIPSPDQGDTSIVAMRRHPGLVGQPDETDTVVIPADFIRSDSVVMLGLTFELGTVTPANEGDQIFQIWQGADWNVTSGAWTLRPPTHRYIYRSIVSETAGKAPPLRLMNRDDIDGARGGPPLRLTPDPSSRQRSLRPSSYL